MGHTCSLFYSCGRRIGPDTEAPLSRSGTKILHLDGSFSKCVALRNRAVCQSQAESAVGNDSWAPGAQGKTLDFQQALQQMEVWKGHQRSSETKAASSSSSTTRAGAHPKTGDSRITQHRKLAFPSPRPSESKGWALILEKNIWKWWRQTDDGWRKMILQGPDAKQGERNSECQQV